MKRSKPSQSLIYGFSDDVGVNVGANVGLSSDLDNKIINEIHLNFKATAQLLGLKFGVSKRTIERHLAKLKKQGIIIRVASDKKGYWELKDIK